MLLAWIPAAAAAPRTFSIDGSKSSASAHVGKTGIGSFAGHEHTVVAQTIQGEVVLDREQISREATFEALDVDSLDLVELAQIVEDEFGVALGADDVKDLKTVGDAVDLIVAKAG